MPSLGEVANHNKDVAEAIAFGRRHSGISASGAQVTALPGDVAGRCYVNTQRIEIDTLLVGEAVNDDQEVSDLGHVVLHESLHAKHHANRIALGQPQLPVDIEEGCVEYLTSLRSGRQLAYSSEIARMKALVAISELSLEQFLDLFLEGKTLEMYVVLDGAIPFLVAA